MYTCISKFKIHQILLPIITIGASITSHADTAQDELVQLKQQVAELSNRIQAIQQQQLTNELQKEQPIATASDKLELKTFTTNNSAAVNLYGYIRADASYQAAGAATIHHHINATPLKNTVEAQQQKDRLRTTLSATRIGINLTTPTPIGDVSGKFETDFYSGANKDQFRIRHAYLTYDNWLIGQTWSNFIAPDYLPETIDAGTFVGGSLQRSPIVRYTHKMNDQTNVVLSIEDPKYTATSDPDNEMRLPALVGRINRSFDNGSVVSARSFIAEKKTSADEALSWGIGLGGKYQITPETILKADYYHVKGDGRFLFWTNTGYVIDDQKKMHGNEFDVISLGLTHQLTSKLRSTFGYGYMKAKDDNTFAKIKYTDSTQNKSLWQGWINAIYNPFKPVSLGLEYAYGERETFDGRNGVDSRINMLAIYEF